MNDDISRRIGDAPCLRFREQRMLVPNKSLQDQLFNVGRQRRRPLVELRDNSPQGEVDLVDFIAEVEIDRQCDVLTADLSLPNGVVVELLEYDNHDNDGGKVHCDEQTRHPPPGDRLISRRCLFLVDSVFRKTIIDI